MFLHAEAQLVFTLADHTFMMKWIINHVDWGGKKAMQQLFFGCWHIDFRFYPQKISPPPPAALQLNMAVQKCTKKTTEKGGGDKNKQ